MIRPGPRPGVSLVVALPRRDRRFDPVALERFAAEAGPLGEVVLVDGSGRGGEVGRWAGRFANVRRVEADAGLAVEGLWRVGLLASDLDRVAFARSVDVPPRGWMLTLSAAPGGGLFDRRALLAGPAADGEVEVEVKTRRGRRWRRDAEGEGEARRGPTMARRSRGVGA